MPKTVGMMGYLHPPSKIGVAADISPSLQNSLVILNTLIMEVGIKKRALSSGFVPPVVIKLSIDNYHPSFMPF